MHELLRSLPVFANDLASFVPGAAPPAPMDLFAEWLQAAVTAGAVEPHAVTLSTVDEHGYPDARVLILKDLQGRGPSFASSVLSAKGHQLAKQPHAALTAYWPVLGRQVRLRGVVRLAGREETERDFAARSADAQALASLGRQSQPLARLGEVEVAVAEAVRARGSDSEWASHWALYQLVVERAEFWQATRSRRHVRLSYEAAGGTWHRQLLWP